MTSAIPTLRGRPGLAPIGAPAGLSDEHMEKEYHDRYDDHLAAVGTEDRAWEMWH